MFKSKIILLIFFLFSNMAMLFGIENKTAQLTVILENFRNDQGQVLVALYDSPTTFGRQDKMWRGIKTAIVAKKATLVFPAVPLGEYGILVLHDENMNNQLDCGLFGIPKEGYAASKNAKGFFGPPKFNDAKFFVQADTTINISLTY